MKCRNCDEEAVGFKELQPTVCIIGFDRPKLYEALCEEHLKEAEHRESHGRYYWLSEKQIKKLESKAEEKQYKKLKKKYENP